MSASTGVESGKAYPGCTLPSRNSLTTPSVVSAGASTSLRTRPRWNSASPATRSAVVQAAPASTHPASTSPPSRKMSPRSTRIAALGRRNPATTSAATDTAAIRAIVKVREPLTRNVTDRAPSTATRPQARDPAAASGARGGQSTTLRTSTTGDENRAAERSREAQTESHPLCGKGTTDRQRYGCGEQEGDESRRNTVDADALRPRASQSRGGAGHPRRHRAQRLVATKEAVGHAAPARWLFSVAPSSTTVRNAGNAEEKERCGTHLSRRGVPRTTTLRIRTAYVKVLPRNPDRARRAARGVVR